MNREDCRHVIREALGREPAAGEVTMFTICLTLNHHSVPRTTEDAARWLRGTTEYFRCTRRATAARSRALVTVPRHSMVALSAAARAIRALQAGFPRDFAVLHHEIGNEIPDILKTLDEPEVFALRKAYGNGRALAGEVRVLTERSSYLNLATGQVFDTEGYLMDVQPDLDAEARAQAQLRRALNLLAWEARLDEGGGPDARPDDLDLEWWDVGSTALGAVEAAVRTLGPEADATAVSRNAIGVMSDRLGSMTDDDERAIKRLVDVRDYPDGILERVRTGRRPVISLSPG